MRKPEQALLCDIGSTYTKLSVVDLLSGRLLARSAASTTPRDVSLGFQQAMDMLLPQLPGEPQFVLRQAASSAAGGLKLAAVGLVRDLTGEAARLAALGAGAKVQAVFSHRLQAEDLQALRQLQPDIVLLAGGTDGGDDAILPHNARQLAESGLSAAIVVAGNREVGPAAVQLLQAAGLSAVLAKNVMPKLGETSVEDARQAIRRLFLQRIVLAKGLRRLQEQHGVVVDMPTPVAVLQALRLLAREEGELLAVDVGGATTDVYSLASGQPQDDQLVPVGLRPPFAHRSVEADLGLRSSAVAMAERYELEIGQLAEHMGISEDWRSWCAKLAADPTWVPGSAAESAREQVLATLAVREAVDRHAGRLQPFVTPFGRSFLLRGKDLRPVRTVIGIGGIFRHAPDATAILGGVAWDNRFPDRLKPLQPSFLIDRDYVFSAAGLVAETHPECALGLMRRSLGMD